MRINNRRLEDHEFTAFEEALRDAFNPGEFRSKMRKRMGWRILDIDADDSIFTKMIDKAENDEETQKLLEKALEEKPGSSQLNAFAQQVGLSHLIKSSIDVPIPSQTGIPANAPKESPDEYLERKVRTLGSSLIPKQWRALMAQRERQICRIVIEGWEEAYGTGFLVNSDVVMTNYHVLQDVIDGDRAIPPSRVSLYFDYELKEDGKTLEKASEHHLIDGEWRLDHSEYSDLDRQYSEHCLDIEERRLDFVLLRLAKKAGEEYIDGVKRGWIEMPEMEYPFQSETPILILHHPNGDTLTFDLDTRSVLEVNARKTRVRYTTTTESGSSGAPCFTANWELIAIHQSGDPNYVHSAEYNQGIPIFTILRRLKKYGTDKYLGPKVDEKAAVPGNTSLIEIEAPESMLPIEKRCLLVSLLDKEDLATYSSSNTKVLCVTREMMEYTGTRKLDRSMR